MPENGPKFTLSDDERAEFKKRLKNLGAKMDKVQKAPLSDDTPSDKGDAENGKAPSSAIGMAMRIGIEFVVAVLIGGGIGWYLDQWLGTIPLFLLIFLLLGFAAGLKNVMRVAKQIQAEPENMGRDVGFDDD